MAATDAGAFRAATFNASLNRSTEGELIQDLATPNDPQVQTVAEIVQGGLLVGNFSRSSGKAEIR